jgi:LysM repeat protein
VRTASLKHRVKRGETIYSIAKKYHVSVASIKKANRLGSKTKLVQGRRLIIPGTQTKTYAAAKSSKKNNAKEFASSDRYKVRKGDTLSTISRRFSVSVDELKRANNLKSGKIASGQVLKIPSGKVKADDENEDVKTKKTVKTVQKDKIDKQILSANDVDELGTNKYIVTKNDSLHSIAKKNKINVAKLLELNNISLKDKLSPGQILVIR